MSATMTSATARPTLEPAARDFADATSKPPFIYELSPAEARKVPVTTIRYDGIIHDFMTLNPLSGTQATRGAIAQAISTLRGALFER